MRNFSGVAPLCGLALMLFGPTANASCGQNGSSLGCFDALPSQGPAEPTVFRSIGEGRVLSVKQSAFSVHYQFAYRPLELVAPSPASEGRIVPIVESSQRVELRAGTGLGRGIDTSVALPVSVYQTGGGSEAISSQRPTPLDSTGLSDLRFVLRTALPDLGAATHLTLRLELTLPTGRETAYFSDGSPTETIAANLAYFSRDFVLAADLGVKSAKMRQFADVAIGTQLLFAAAAAYRAIKNELLTVAVELRAQPYLVPSPSPNENRYPYPASRDTFAMPTEANMNLTSRAGSHPIWFSVGAGTALPLSHRSGALSYVDNWFVAPTTPRLRVAASAMFRF